MQCSRWKRMAGVSDEQLTGLIDKCNSSGREITSSAVLKLAKRTRAAIPIDETEGEEGVVGSLESLIECGAKFKTIYADPPWQYANQGTRAATSDHYGTMTVDEIAALPVESLVDDVALLFLWTTNGFLRQSFDVIDAWGFEFKSSMVWVKSQMGIGNYVRNAHEFLLIANRGGMLPTDARKTQISWIESRRGSHSAKPGEFRRVVERLSVPDRLELFGRSKADGWTVFGNQIAASLL